MNLQSYVYRAYIQWQSKLSKSAIYNGNLLVTYARTSSHIEKNVQSRTHTQIKKKAEIHGKNNRNLNPISNIFSHLFPLLIFMYLLDYFSPSLRIELE